MVRKLKFAMEISADDLATMVLGEKTGESHPVVVYKKGEKTIRFLMGVPALAASESFE